MGMTLTEYVDCTPRDLFNFLSGAKDRIIEEREFFLDCTRRVMWASLTPYSKNEIKLDKLIRISTDQKEVELTPFVKQELDNWAAEMDKEMGIK
jgi:hypothetical protein